MTSLQAQEMMVGFYKTLPFEQKVSYAKLFESLADAPLPLVFNCSAGKDRTGLAAALILSALGVPYETVMEDYLLSNHYLDSHAIQSNKGLAQLAAQLSPDVAGELLSVNSLYLDASLDEIRLRHGTLERYFHDVLGVSSEQIECMKTRLLN
ncbi:MAG: hypothetical protein COA43_00865 [Robiginitomaculum sp.]|nr:MAG: hypothetical protein COA43_00865 [Robiginitomaculum sp.]